MTYQKKAIEIREEILGHRHLDLATAYNDIGITYQALKQNVTAIYYHKKSISIREEVLDSKHPSLATAYNNIAWTYHALGRYKTAREYHKRSVGIQKETSSLNSPSLKAPYGYSIWPGQISSRRETISGHQQISVIVFKESLEPWLPNSSVSYGNIGGLLRGRLIFLNSTPAVGVKISGTIKNTGNTKFIYTAEDGSFTLAFPKARVGTLVNLELGTGDNKEEAIEFVSENNVSKLRIPANAKDEFEIIVRRKKYKGK